MWLDVEGEAREGEPFRVQVRRNGGAGEDTTALIQAVDSASSPTVTSFVVDLHREGSRADADGNWEQGFYALPVAADGIVERGAYAQPGAARRRREGRRLVRRTGPGRGDG